MFHLSKLNLICLICQFGIFSGCFVTLQLHSQGSLQFPFAQPGYSVHSLHSAPFRIQTLYILSTFITFSSLRHTNTLCTKHIHYIQLPSGYKHFIYSIHSLHSAPFRIQTLYILSTFPTFSSLQDTNTLYTQCIHYIQLPSGYKHFIYSIHSLHSAPFRIQTLYILNTFTTFNSLQDTKQVCSYN